MLLLWVVRSRGDLPLRSNAKGEHASGDLERFKRIWSGDSDEWAGVLKERWVSSCDGPFAVGAARRGLGRGTRGGGATLAPACRLA
jgi:hypothetical protein